MKNLTNFSKTVETHAFRDCKSRPQESILELNLNGISLVSLFMQSCKEQAHFHRQWCHSVENITIHFVFIVLFMFRKNKFPVTFNQNSH